MKKPGKISIIFTISIVLFAIFSPNLIGQQNTAEARCLDSDYGSCVLGWGTAVTLFCGGVSFLLNMDVPICILTTSGGAGAGNDLGTLPSMGYTCTNVNLGLNPVVNFGICEAIALTLVGIRCTNDHLIPCVCTPNANIPPAGTMCAGDNANLPNGLWDKDIPWLKVGNYSTNCTTRKCEYYTPCVANCGCAANTCTGSTCRNSCNTGNCSGTKSCVCTPNNASCASNICPNQTCWDGCNNIVGKKDCTCTPNNTSCADDTCVGETCNDGCNDIDGTKNCDSATGDNGEWQEIIPN